MEIEWLSSFLDYIKTGIDKNLSEYIISLNGKKTLSYQIALCVLSFPLKSAAISSIASEIDSALSMAQEEGFDKISKELIDEMNSFMFPSPSELNTKGCPYYKRMHYRRNEYPFCMLFLLCLSLHVLLFYYESPRSFQGPIIQESAYQSSSSFGGS